MNTSRNMFYAIFAGIIIILISLFAAYICFHVLESSASGELKEWKLGGAFAGFAFTLVTLSPIVMQIYKTLDSKQNEEYRRTIKELEMKLIKGAQCPEGYSIDLDERHKVVFSRPDEWVPLGGLLYQYIDKKGTDNFHANFNVGYSDADDIKVYSPQFFANPEDMESLYIKAVEMHIESVQKQIPSYNRTSLSKEYIKIDEIKSMKYIHGYSVNLDGKNTLDLTQIGVFVYVKKYHKLYAFTFSDDKTSFLKTSEIFSNIISSIRFL